MLIVSHASWIHWSDNCDKNTTIGKYLCINPRSPLLVSHSKCISCISEAQNAIISTLFSNANNNNFICPLHSCAYIYKAFSPQSFHESSLPESGRERRGCFSQPPLLLPKRLGGNIWKIVEITMDERTYCAVWTNTMQAKVHLINLREHHWRHCYLGMLFRPCAVCHSKWLLSDLSVCLYWNGSLFKQIAWNEKWNTEWETFYILTDGKWKNSENGYSTKTQWYWCSGIFITILVSILEHIGYFLGKTDILFFNERMLCIGFQCNILIMSLFKDSNDSVSSYFLKQL